MALQLGCVLWVHRLAPWTSVGDVEDRENQAFGRSGPRAGRRCPTQRTRRWASQSGPRRANSGRTERHLKILSPRSAANGRGSRGARQAGGLKQRGTTLSYATGNSRCLYTPIFNDFTRLTDPALYTPLPDGWVLGISDIVQSTAAIAAGRYKVVNTAAAAVIAAVANALGGHDFPFVFGGDGANFALPPEHAELARAALASVAAWVRDELELQMRVALVPIEAVRANGFDVRIARFAPSPDVTYAMFTGGGLAWAEQQMKAGQFAVTLSSAQTHPDLNGLSCRFSEIKAERGVILSLIILPCAEGDPAAFTELIARILERAEGGADVGRPVPTRVLRCAGRHPALISRRGRLVCMRAPVWQPVSGLGHARLHPTSSSERACGLAALIRLGIGDSSWRTRIFASSTTDCA